MNRIISILKIFLGWPISILALFFIARIIQLKSSDLILNLNNLNYQLLFYGFFCYLIFYFLRAFVWQKILREKGYDLSLKESTFLWGLSELKRYVPGNIWSFLGRVMLFSEKKIPKKEILSAIFIEIQFLLISCFLLSLLSISFIVFNFLPNNFHSEFFISIALFISFLGTAIFIFNKVPYLSTKFLPSSNLSLTFLAVIYMFFYGLGTYFIIASVVFLSSLYLLTFVGFFVFSLLAGYLSIIAPMGLGVREGIMILGLSKFIPVGAAGIATIFSRIILILSELSFLLISFFWNRVKNKYLLNFEIFIGKFRYEIMLIFFIFVYILYFSTTSFLRFDNFFTGRFDLGNMDQTVWNTSQGRIFQLTNPDGTEIITRLAIHADFFLVLIAPLYFLWSDPKILLLLQTIVLGFGAIFIFLLSEKFLKNKNISLAFAFTYLLNPSLQYGNLYDFHAVTLATTFLLGALYFFIERKYLYFGIFAFLSALTKEQVWLIISIFGLYSIYNNAQTFLKKEFSVGLFIKKSFYPIVFFALSFTVFYYLIWFLIPSVKGGNHFALAYYSDFGSSPTDIAKNLIISPDKIVNIIFQNGRINYLNELFLPLGYLPILSPVILVFALPDFAINLLSNNPQLHQIYYQYSSTIIPFLFFSLIMAVYKLRKKFPNISSGYIIIYILSFTLYSAYSFGPLPGAKKPNIDMFTKPYQNKDDVKNFLASIPKEHSIAATNNLGSHLSQREYIFTIPIGMDKADFIAFLLNDKFAQPSPQAQIQMVFELKQNKNYTQVYKKDDFIVFKKIKND